MQIERGTSKGQLVAYVFGQDAIAASQTDVQLPAVGPEEGSTVDGYTIPFDFEVVAVTSTTTAAATAGQMTIGATIGGTEDTDSTLTITTETNGYLAVQRGKMRGVAGDRLGCELTTNSGWDAVTADGLFTVYAVLYLDGI